MLHSRRTFLQTATAIAAGMALPSRLLGSYLKPQIALQLYSIREAMALDVAAALDRVARMGYTAVETAFFPEGMTIADAATLLRNAGLRAVACHAEIPVGDLKDDFLKAADTFECKRMVWHGWPEDERYQSMEGIKRLAEIYNEASVFAQANGLQFGLHNHWWELEEVPGVGLPWYTLREMISSEIFFEVDTYWAKVAGQDPAKVVADFGEHAPLLHIKDGAVLTEEGPMVAVGDGVLDFPAIAEAGGEHTQYMIVEMDTSKTDMFDALDKSYQYLTGNHLASG